MGDAADSARKARAISRTTGLIIGLALFSAFATGAAAACYTPEKLSPPVGAVPFKQVRTLKGVSKPLVSYGEVSADVSRIVWHVKKPVEVVTQIDATGVSQAVAGGALTPVGAGSGAEFLSKSGLSDLLRQDFSNLDANYKVHRTARTAPAGWAVDLTPKDKRLSAYASAIHFESCSRLESVLIEQTNGDKIQVEFSEPAK